MENNFINSEKTKSLYIQAINTTEIKKRDKLKKLFINHNNIDGAFVEITGNAKDDYVVTFHDNDTGELVHRSTIKCNMWTKTNKKYYTNWRIEIKNSSGDTIFLKNTDLSGKKIYIAIDSSSLGDNLAWIPYAEEFRKKHGCELIVSTFWNSILEKSYPNMKFVNPGEVVSGIYAMYKIGCFYNSDLEPELCNTLPLQKVASNILGLDYKEIKPIVNTESEITNWPVYLTTPYVTIAPHSTAGLKHWNNPTGWQEVVDFLISKGYKVINVSREGCELNSVKNLDDYSIDNIMLHLRDSKFFIGLSSGLSWLAWAMNKHVFMISNFTNKEHEFNENCTRIINESVCNSCWNNPDFKFDKGDWNWCPIHKGTDRQFECSKSITGKMVINHIEKFLLNSNFLWGSSSKEFMDDITKEIFEDRIYERLYEVKEGDVVVDVGASVGPFTYSILNKNPKKIYCLEPGTKQFSTLKKNFEGKQVVCINKGITNVDGPLKSDYIFGEDSREIMSGIKFKSFLREYKIDKIDFLKLDCEGGEYDIINDENIEFIKNNVGVISAEVHLRSDELKGKFRKFRDEILIQLDNYKIFSLDGIDITSSLYSEDFISYYKEVMLYMKN